MRSTRTAVSLIALLALAGCDAILGPSDNPASIEIRSPRETFDWVGTTAKLEAEVRNADGDVLSSDDVVWAVGDSSVATVDGEGVLMTRANGITWVTGKVDGAIDFAQIRVESPLPCLPTGILEVPDTVNDEIVPGECGPEDRYTEVWQLDITTAGTYTIDLSSGDFNTLLILLDSEGDLVGMDYDGGEVFNSRLIGRFPTGRFYVLVRPNAGGVGGAYRLSIRQGTPPSRCPPQGTLSFPDTVSGTTSAAESCDYDGYYIDVWRMELADTTTLTLELVGDGFGMYFAITDTTGQFLNSSAEGPSDGGWLEAKVPPGAYDIWAGARETGVAGDYTLAVKRGPATLYCPAAGTIEVGQSVAGGLADDDCYALYAPSDGWALEITDTTDVTMAVNAVDANFPAILVTDSMGALIGVGYQGFEQFARYDTTMVPGSYRVWIQSATVEPGDYRLSVVSAGEMGACEPQATAVLDSTYDGALATSDCPLVDGRYVDVWSIQLDSATTASFDLMSDKFDAYLILTDTAGTTLDRDDDSGTETNASLSMALDSGTYHLWVTSYAAESIGGYQLAVAGATASALAERVDGIGSPDPGAGRSAAWKRGGGLRLRDDRSARSVGDGVPRWLRALAEDSTGHQAGGGPSPGQR